MTITFNGTAKTATLSSGTTELSVLDLWSRWVDWSLTADNSKYEPAMRQAGGDDINADAGTSVPIYIFLLNGWRIQPADEDHTLDVVDAILLVEGGGDPFLDADGATVRINYQQPVQAIGVAGGSGGGASPSAIADAVWNKMLDDKAARQRLIDADENAEAGVYL